jgi:hypothetical protein
VREIAWVGFGTRRRLEQSASVVLLGDGPCGGDGADEWHTISA